MLKIKVYFDLKPKNEMSPQHQSLSTVDKLSTGNTYRLHVFIEWHLIKRKETLPFLLLDFVRFVRQLYIHLCVRTSQSLCSVCDLMLRWAERIWRAFRISILFCKKTTQLGCRYLLFSDVWENRLCVLINWENWRIACLKGTGLLIVNCKLPVLVCPSSILKIFTYNFNLRYMNLLFFEVTSRIVEE